MAESQHPVVRRGDRFLYVALAMIATLIVFVGFSRTYYLKGMFGTPPLSILAHVHGVLFTSWLLLLIVQVTLVTVRRTDIHRRLGIAGGVLAVLMVCAGILMSLNTVWRTTNRTDALQAIRFLTIPFFDMVVFAILVAAAFYYRRKPEFHKRLMVVATIAILPAAISRIPLTFIRSNGALAFFGLADLLLVACVLYDCVVYRRLQPAYLWGGLLLIASHPVRIIIGGTAAWRTFAGWMTGI